MQNSYNTLLVEDSCDDRAAFTRMLLRCKTRRYIIEEAESTAEGLLALSEQKFDCVLLDYNLPGSDGLQFLRQICQNYLLLPIIMLTGQGNEKIAVDALKLGAQDYIRKKDAMINGDLSDTIQKAIRDKQLEIFRLNQHLIDELTGLARRTLFMQHLEQSLKMAERYGGKIGVLFLDLDNFKPVNDTFGHAAGDKLLISVSQRLLNSVRDVDCVARFGGDEFVICLANLGEDAETTCRLICDRIVKAVCESQHDIGDEFIKVCLSIGVVVAENGNISAEELLKSADHAMYRAKNMSDCTMCIFNAECSLDMPTSKEYLDPNLKMLPL